MSSPRADRHAHHSQAIRGGAAAPNNSAPGTHAANELRHGDNHSPTSLLMDTYDETTRHEADHDDVPESDRLDRGVRGDRMHAARRPRDEHWHRPPGGVGYARSHDRVRP